MSEIASEPEYRPKKEPEEQDSSRSPFSLDPDLHDPRNPTPERHPDSARYPDLEPGADSLRRPGRRLPEPENPTKFPRSTIPSKWGTTRRPHTPDPPPLSTTPPILPRPPIERPILSPRPQGTLITTELSRKPISRQEKPLTPKQEKLISLIDNPNTQHNLAGFLKNVSLDTLNQTASKLIQQIDENELGEFIKHLLIADTPDIGGWKISKFQGYLIQRINESIKHLEMWSPLDDPNLTATTPQITLLDIELASLQEFTNHLFVEAKNINVFLSKAAAYPNKSSSHLHEAVISACSALNFTTEEQIFRDAIIALGKVRQDHKDEFLHSLVTRLSSFLERERELLIKSEIPENLVNEMINNCKMAFYNALNGKSTPGKMFRAIERLKNETCAASNQFRKREENVASKEKTKHLLKATVKAISGIAIVSLNAGTAISRQLNFAEAAISGAMGGGLIEMAIDDFIN
ncbi:MAG: hypothetical protein DWQ04_28640 [Chloroflexi bacterium]|nr:MAG: hypothetical protein DWQ04_28640 [Chloroflexota bacterium]